MKKYLLFSVIFLVSTSFLFIDQNSIGGTVTGPDGFGVIQAEVVLLQNNNVIKGTITDFDGHYNINNIKEGTYDLKVSYLGLATQLVTGVVVKSGKSTKVDITMSEDIEVLDEVCIKAYKVPLISHDQTSSCTQVTSESIRKLGKKSVKGITNTSSGLSKQSNNVSIRGSRSKETYYYQDGIRVSGIYPKQEAEQENYELIAENMYKSVTQEPLSTLSIDVDRASYSNMRRFINQGMMPPKDAIRVEEMINYFDYNYPQPKRNADRPFDTDIAVTQCPWNTDHHLMRVGLQGRNIESDNLPPNNFVFLIDVSGSMNSANKLPLLKSAFKLLVNQLRPEDQVAITVYAGAAGTVLEPTKGDQKEKILEALNNLRAGGSTAGAEGIELAYKLAEKNFNKEGNNRVIIATDGDFNVGISDDDALVRLIETKRNKGIFLSIMGFGQGNYRDNKMQKLANHGNGNHSYIDNMKEAKKVLIDEFGGTMFTIAKDVKIQIEFNPAEVSSYRLVGYENRLLAAEDFNDDTKDAGEMGAGHSVTVLYEIIPTGINSKYNKTIDPLKYQKNKVVGVKNGELGTIKYRFKHPEKSRSIKSEESIAYKVVDFDEVDPSFAWASSVAEFGLLLRNSSFQENASFEHVLNVVKPIAQKSNNTYKLEFVEIVEIAQSLAKTN